MLRLERAYLDNCTIGKLFFQGEFVCYTVEKPWKNNAKSISCIPAGIYWIEPYHSQKYPNCYSLKCNALGVSVTGQHRTYILIHPANFPSELEGCIAPGLELHPERWGVSRSRDAMGKLRVLIEDRNLNQIEIK